MGLLGHISALEVCFEFCLKALCPTKLHDFLKYVPSLNLISSVPVFFGQPHARVSSEQSGKRERHSNSDSSNARGVQSLPPRTRQPLNRARHFCDKRRNAMLVASIEHMVDTKSLLRDAIKHAIDRDSFPALSGAIVK